MTSQVIKCVLCDETHNLVDKKLPVNAQLNNILKKEPDEIYRGTHHSEALQIIEAVESLNDDLKGLVDNTEMVIKSHFDNLRDEVDISAESVIEAVNSYRSQYIEHIDNMQQACFENFFLVCCEQKV